MSIPILKNFDLFRRQVNANLPGYDTALPGIDATPDGRLFADSSTGKLYQAQGGAWVEVSGDTDTGITQLTGDVTAGPGSGSQAATLANTAVTPGSYGNATTVATLTVDAKGRLTAAGTAAIAFPNTYAEGTWTPAIAFGGASVGVAYGSRSGTWTKIGRMVFATCTIGLSSKGSSTGALSITGLPHTVAANAPGNIYPSAWASGNSIVAVAVQGTTIIGVDNFAAGTTSAVTDANLNNFSTIILSVAYPS